MKSGVWIAGAIAGSFAMGMVIGSVQASGPGKPDARVTGIGGIFFKAQDPQKLGDWYRDHLGIASEAGGAGPDAPRYHLFEWGDKDHPDRESITVWSVFPQNTKYFGTGPAPFMVNYRVGNLDQLMAQLRQEGVKVEDCLPDRLPSRIDSNSGSRNSERSRNRRRSARSY
jgi:catechol 2,3-dioxygenase-like lactoylglutathione lyase family enzyme